MNEQSGTNQIMESYYCWLHQQAAHNKLLFICVIGKQPMVATIHKPSKHKIFV